MDMNISYNLRIIKYIIPSFIKGVVGWVDFASPRLRRVQRNGSLTMLTANWFGPVPAPFVDMPVYGL